MSPEEIPFKVPFGKISRRIVMVLATRFERWVPTQELISVAYFDDPTGGPQDAKSVVKAHIHLIRQKLASHGYRIEGHMGAGRRLVRD